MSFWSNLDPSGRNFLGLGPTFGRFMGDTVTGGAMEFHRPDPFGLPRKSNAAGAIGGMGTGAASGAASGAVVGGPYGAIAGGILGGAAGGIMGGLGKTDPNFTAKGTLENIGIGGGAGALGGAGVAAYGGGAAGGSGAAISGPGSISGGSGAGMTAYTPTSTPVMGQAGSTLGGGMSAPTNLAPAYGSQMGAAGGTTGGTTGSSANVLQRMRQANQMSGGQQQDQQQAPPAESILQKIYRMYPQLKPGAHIGGQYGA